MDSFIFKLIVDKYCISFLMIYVVETASGDAGSEYFKYAVRTTSERKM